MLTCRGSRSLLISSSALILPFLSACGGGGGGGSSDGMVIQGNLTERAGVVGEKSLQVGKHSASQRIADVKICLLDVCSVTDGKGQYGIVAPDTFKGGTVEMSVVGHFIDATAPVTIPANAKNVVAHIGHAAPKVYIEHLEVDGKLLIENEEAHNHDTEEHSVKDSVEDSAKDSD